MGGVVRHEHRDEGDQEGQKDRPLIDILERLLLLLRIAQHEEDQQQEDRQSGADEPYARDGDASSRRDGRCWQ